MSNATKRRERRRREKREALKANLRGWANPPRDSHHAQLRQLRADAAAEQELRAVPRPDAHAPLPPEAIRRYRQANGASAFVFADRKAQRPRKTYREASLAA